MTERELAEIEARAKAATPGPWSCGAETIKSEDGLTRVAECRQEFNGGPADPREVNGNVNFLTNAREDIPALVAEVRRLRELVALNATLGGPIVHGETVATPHIVDISGSPDVVIRTTEHVYRWPEWVAFVNDGPEVTTPQG